VRSACCCRVQSADNAGWSSADLLSFVLRLRRKPGCVVSSAFTFSFRFHCYSIMMARHLADSSYNWQQTYRRNSTMISALTAALRHRLRLQRQMQLLCIFRVRCLISSSVLFVCVICTVVTFVHLQTANRVHWRLIVFLFVWTWHYFCRCTVKSFYFLFGIRAESRHHIGTAGQLQCLTGGTLNPTHSLTHFCEMCFFFTFFGLLCRIVWVTPKDLPKWVFFRTWSMAISGPTSLFNQTCCHNATS